MASDTREDAVDLAKAADSTFRRDLPQLLRQRPGDWVAYRGARLLGFGPTKADVYDLCIEMGLARGDFVVRSIEPDIDEMVVGPL
jgi:hypothetical protein